MKSLIGKIEKFISGLAEQAMQNDTSIENKIEAAKVIGPYYLAMTKRKGNDESEDEEPSIAELTRKIHLVEGNNGR